MGPNTQRLRGIGSGLVGGGNAAPTAPGNGSGGAGNLSIVNNPAGLTESASNEINDVLAGRITLGMIGVSVLALSAFYIYTRGSQNGG